MTAYVVDADPIHENSVNYFSAALGFYRLGYFVERYELSALSSFSLSEETPVFGGIESIHTVLPDYTGLPYYPPELAEFMHRNVEKRLIGEVKLGEFFKPAEEDHKLFSPRVKDDSFDSDLLISRIPPETAVFAVQAVKFVSEFRVYVNQGEVLDVCRYKGNPLQFPDTGTIAEMVSRCAYYSSGFGLDVGVTSEGATALVELNDFCCLGNYGLRAIDYARAIAVRWEEAWNQFSPELQNTESGRREI
ncbi:MAG: ATP-grasp domain-containing protein [Verrucomicrobiales bacterium]